jgi:hypothetical protein
VPLASLSISKDVAASAPVSTTGSLSPDLTSLPLSSSVGPEAPTHLGAAFRGVVDFPRPPEPSDTVDCAGEFCPFVAPFLTASWGSQSCQASAPWAGKACSVHLAKVWSPVSHCQSCHGTRSERPRVRARRAVHTLHLDAGCVLRPVVGRTAQACSVLWLGRSRPSARCARGPSSVSAQKPFKN